MRPGTLQIGAGVFIGGCAFLTDSALLAAGYFAISALMFSLWWHCAGKENK